jgi:hypothetical protein
LNLTSLQFSISIEQLLLGLPPQRITLKGKIPNSIHSGIKLDLKKLVLVVFFRILPLNVKSNISSDLNTMTDNTIRVRDDIEDDPDAIITDDGNQDSQDGDGTVPVPPATPAAARTTLAFKVEQSKIPEYFGQKGKDNITAIVFIRKIKDLASTNRWTDATTYANVANNLKGFARKWLFATADMLDWTPAQLTWTNLKPRFQ